jgi:hypothetical protein
LKRDKGRKYSKVIVLPLSFSYPVSSAVAAPGAPLRGLSAARAWRLYFRNSSVLFRVVPRDGATPLVEATPPRAVVTSMLLGSNPNLPREEAISVAVLFR